MLEFDLYQDSTDIRETKIAQFQEGVFIDEQTNSVALDFILYNPNYAVFTYIILEFRFKETGLIWPKINLSNIRREYYSGGLGITRGICEVLYALFFLFYILLELLEIFSDIIEAKAEEERQVTSDENVSGWRKKLKIVVKGIKIHFASGWNWIDAVYLILSLCAIIYWIQFIISQLQLDISQNHFSVSKYNQLFNNCDRLLQSYTRICSFSLVLIFVRVLKYLAQWFERVSVLFDTLAKAKSDTFYFLIMLVTIFFAFVIMAHLYFGTNNEKFKTIFGTVSVCFDFVLSEVAEIESMIQFSNVYSLIFFVIFMVSIQFILVNMFIAFISNAYGSANEELVEKKAKDMEENKAQLEKHFCNHLKDLFYKIGGCCSKRIKAKYEEDNKKVRRLRYIAAIGPGDTFDFDITFVPASDTIRRVQIPFLSEQEEAENRKVREKTCGKVFWGAILFIIYLIVYISLVLMQLQIKTGFTLNQSLREAIGGANYKILQETEDPTDAYRAFEDILTFEDLTLFLSESLPDIAGSKTVDGEEYYFIGEANYLLEGKYRVHFRKGERRNSSDIMESTFYQYDEGTNELSGSFYGEKSFHVYLYEEDGYYVDIHAATCSEDVQRIIDDHIIDSGLWEFKIELVVYEATSDFYIYCEVLFEFLKSGYIRKVINPYPLQLNKYKTSLDHFRAFLEGLYLAFLAYYIVKFVQDIIHENKAYNLWFTNEVVGTFSDLQRLRREMKKPEWLRKFLFIFSIFKTVEALAFLFSFITIIFWIRNIANVFSLNLTLPIPPGENENIYEDLRSAAGDMSNYTNFCAIKTIFVSIRLLEFMKKSKHMNILTTTLYNAREDTYYFLLILACMLTGFVGMANVSFGYFLREYSTFGDAFRKCFEIIIGDFSFEDLSRADSVMAILFFYPFIVLFVFILTNIFLAILDKHYGDLKEKSSQTDDKINKLKTLLCCFIKSKGDEKNDKTEGRAKDLAAKRDEELAVC